MKAILVKNKKLGIEDTEIPSVKDDEVLIKVKAAGLNRADIAQKNGLYPPPPGASEILGLECSGIIEDIGKNESFRATLGGCLIEKVNQTVIISKES